MLKKIFEENLSPTEAAEFVLNVMRCRHSDPHLFFEQIEAGKEFKSFGDVLKHAFAWENTEQGFEYWRDILERERALEYDEPPMCVVCNGSGEGMWDGSTCGWCKGSGVIISKTYDI